MLRELLRFEAVFLVASVAAFEAAVFFDTAAFVVVFFFFGRREMVDGGLLGPARLAFAWVTDCSSTIRSTT
ncbi:hypothetical protein [Streptomyces sp. Isolate_45]|uniref:hypothetical protein n=1 Tax=Streptomyces sp. Isolate_45 TaxID=2950111 RepID=UPI002481C140|nr:hypothetical protein [Streptomyces sp. Isolate_45]MDA5286412.1 hypothetical protein [Streptomyces sp. Isolate_45]